MKTYRVEIDALAYYDVEANSEAEAKAKVPEYFSQELNNNGSIFYEAIDHKKAKAVIYE
tara:strand:- start:197 stop:373 length:177 start_codon:yes stop_codon:yes gene_type:complete